MAAAALALADQGRPKLLTQQRDAKQEEATISNQPLNV